MLVENSKLTGKVYGYLRNREKFSTLQPALLLAKVEPDSVVSTFKRSSVLSSPSERDKKADSKRSKPVRRLLSGSTKELSNRPYDIDARKIVAYVEEEVEDSS